MTKPGGTPLKMDRTALEALAAVALGNGRQVRELIQGEPNEAVVLALASCSWGTWQIADLFGVSSKKITQLLHAALEHCPPPEDQLADIRKLELAKLDLYERSLFDRYLRSNQPREITTVTESTGVRGGTRTTIRKAPGEDGANIMAQIQRIGAARRQLLGLDAATKIDIRSMTLSGNLNQYTDVELDRIIRDEQARRCSGPETPPQLCQDEPA